MDDAMEWKGVIEGLLFVSGEGLDAKTLAEILELDTDSVVNFVYELKEDLKKASRGVQIIEIAGTFQLTTLQKHAPYFEKLASSPSHTSLSQAALETLAITAYKQPITRAEIEEIRGVKCEKAIYTLASKKLIREVGRAEATGRPILYGTTKEFLEYFGLGSISDLPPIPVVALDEAVELEVEILYEKMKKDG